MKKFVHHWNSHLSTFDRNRKLTYIQMHSIVFHDSSEAVGIEKTPNHPIKTDAAS